MMGGDTLEAAQKAFGKFKDERVTQFYDPEKAAGRAFPKSLGHEGEIAWDFYLFYPVQSVWQEFPPVPELYMHQLRDSWADQNRLFEKDELKVEMTKTMQLLFP
jgi:hypothetical protein